MKKRLSFILRLGWLKLEMVYIFFFWFGLLYVVFAILYRFFSPLKPMLASLIKIKALPFMLYYFLKGLHEVLNYLLGADLSVIMGLIMSVLGLSFKYLGEVRQEEVNRKLEELKLRSPKEAAAKLLVYHEEAQREGWDYKLKEVVEQRKEEFLTAVLEDEPREALVKVLKHYIKDRRLDFLDVYLKKERDNEDWQFLLETLPQFLEDFGGAEKWRKAFYEEARKCAEHFTPDKLFTEWFKTRSGRELLRIPEIWSKLPEEWQKRVGPRVEIPWPEPEKLPKRRERSDIEQWCEVMGLKFSPFGPERAEEDPLLFGYYVMPAFWNELLNPQPALVIGLDGSGKSALALYLLHRLCEDYKNFERKTLGLFMSIFKPDAEALAFNIGETFALRTIELAAHNPFVFLEFSQRSRLCYFWRLFIPKVKAELMAQGLNEPLLSSFAEELEKLGPIFPLASISTQRLGELLGSIMPLLGEFDAIYLLVDLKNPFVLTHELSLWLESWINLMPMLLGANVYPKIMCPSFRAIAQTSGWAWDVFALEWDESALSQMLEERLRKSVKEEKANEIISFDALCSPPLMGIAGKIVRASKGSPRNLIRIGNEILKRAAAHLDDPSIKEEDLRDVSL